MTPQVRVLATNFGPLSSAAAPSIRGFFRQTVQGSSLKSSSSPRNSSPVQGPVQGTGREADSACLLPAPELVVRTPARARLCELTAAHGSKAVLSAQHTDLHTERSASGITPTPAEACLSAQADPKRAPPRDVEPDDVDIDSISIAEQAIILAGIKKRAALSTSAVRSALPKTSSKRSRQGDDASQGQEASSAKQQPELRQRRISDVFKRLRQTDGG